MNPSDNDMREELKNEPFTRNGFDQRLQRKILERAGQTERTRPKATRLAWGGGAFALVLFSIILWGNGLHEFLPFDKLLSKQNTSGSGSPSAYETLHNGTAAESEFQSALLVGLRTDYPAQAGKAAYSKYRTVLVAPANGELIQAAEGEGILMPYKTDFWLIETATRKKKNKEVQILSASPASSSAKITRAGDETEKAEEPFIDDLPENGEVDLAGPSGPLVVKYGNLSLASEKLLFAGNRTLAVQQEVEGTANGLSPLTFLWVKHIEQLKLPRQEPYDPAVEPHISIQEAIPSWKGNNDGGYRPYYDNWTVIRKPGRWIVQEAVISSSVSGSEVFTLHDVLVQLPEEVASFDKLSVAWEEIWRREPDAIDAYSSPESETVAIIKDDRISFYLNGGSLAEKPSLELKLQKAEKIVMMQWATQSYVDRWKRQVHQLFGPYDK